MAIDERRLQELLQQTPPQSSGVDYAEVSRRGRRRQRGRRVATAGVVVVLAGAVSAVVVGISTGGHASQATIHPLPDAGPTVTKTLVPSSQLVGYHDLSSDAEVLTRRLAAAGINGRVSTGNGSVSLTIPASASDSVPYLTTTGNVAFRIPVAEEPARTTSDLNSAACASAPGSATGAPPQCITEEFLGETCPSAMHNFGFVEPPQPPNNDWLVACDASNSVEYALRPASLDGSAISGAQATIQSSVDGTSTGQWIVNVDFTGEGQRAWSNLTDTISTSPGCPASGASTANPPATCQLAIVVDGTVLSAPVVQERIAGSAEITGSFTEQSAKALAAALGSGTLPIPLAVSHS